MPSWVVGGLILLGTARWTARRRRTLFYSKSTSA
jgi:hypothetical protein